MRNKITIIISLLFFLTLTMSQAACSGGVNSASRPSLSDSPGNEAAETNGGAGQMADVPSEEMTDQVVYNDSSEPEMLLPMKSPGVDEDAIGESESPDDSDEPGQSTEIEGQILEGGKGMVPRGWPSDVTIPLEFDVRYGAADQSGIKLVIFGSDSAETVREFYQQLDGWEIISEIEPEIDEKDADEIVKRILITMNKFPDVLTIDAIEQENETLVQLHYNEG